MNFLTIILLTFTASISFAKDKKSRNPASETGACETQAGNAVLAAVKALGQEVTLENVKLDFLKANHETYKVKLIHTDEGCSFDSITMPMKIFN